MKNEAIHARITKVLIDLGNRVYELQLKKGESVFNASFAFLEFGEFKDEQQFFQLQEDGTAFVNIHRCPNLIRYENAFYAWQGRLKGRLPTACPSCHYRLDSKPKRGV